MPRYSLTGRVICEPFLSIVIRWLGLILLVLSIHPPGLGASGPSSGRSMPRVALWGLVTSGVTQHVADWSVDVCDDDDDQDDSAPSQPGSPFGGSDDDALCAGTDWRIPSAGAQLALSFLAENGLGPASGHSPDTERPPRAA